MPKQQSVPSGSGASSPSNPSTGMSEEQFNQSMLERVDRLKSEGRLPELETVQAAMESVVPKLDKELDPDLASVLTPVQLAQLKQGKVPTGLPKGVASALLEMLNQEREDPEEAELESEPEEDPELQEQDPGEGEDSAES